MKGVPRSETPATRRQPKTQRGRATRGEILTAARQLLCQQWVDDVPFTELAASAGVARASLLHAFPHWRNVLWDLFEEEADLLAKSYLTAVALKRARPSDRTYAMLSTLLERAEMTGRLYANLRSAMFTWHGNPSEEDFRNTSPDLPLRREVLGSFARIVLNDTYVLVEQLLRLPWDESLKPDQFRPAPIGECLVNFAFDLAAGSPINSATIDERRRTLRLTIDLVAAGVRATKPLNVTGRRRSPHDSLRPTRAG